MTASWLGISSYYSEVNPFMSFVTDTKVNKVREARANLEATESGIASYRSRLQSASFQVRAESIDLEAYHKAFPGRDFFEDQHIRKLLAAKDLALEVAAGEPWLQSILLLACAANAVHSSNMTRRADLRRRRADEYVNRRVDVVGSINETTAKILTDVRALPDELAETTKVSEDCRDASTRADRKFDLAVTSPPYLNGTNYFRNTKIELWLTDYIKTEKELGDYRLRAIAAGINNISSKRPPVHSFDFVESVAERLDILAPDKRIPALVRHYFSDMSQMFSSVSKVLQPGAPFVLDIGDSKYYSVHVPTDKLLIKVAESTGLALVSNHVLARRYSRDRSPLVQVELTFRKAH